MKVLFVWNTGVGTVPTFITEQLNSMRKVGHTVELYEFKYSGPIGYLKNYFATLVDYKYFYQFDIVHAHYGLTGIIFSFIPCRPLVVTFHGSDINNKKAYYFSYIASLLSTRNIFVTDKLMTINHNKNHVISCGVDTDIFEPDYYSNDNNNINILFGSSKDRYVKNYPFAKSVSDYLSQKGHPNTLITLEGVSRKKVAKLINSSDCCILTSITEGSPQFIKEAMSCNSPIVSADVGDVKELINNVDGCYVINIDNSESVELFAQSIVEASSFRKKYKYTNGRNVIFQKKLDLNQTAIKVSNVYESIFI